MNVVCVLLFLVVCLTRVSLANNFYLPRLPLRERIRGQGFYDENEYDDGYAEYTGAEKRTFSEMQRRRFQNVQEDESQDQEKREAMEDLLLRELTRGKYHTAETNDEEYPEANHRRLDDERREESFVRVPESSTKSDELKDQTKDGVGTAIDDLALKREEEKMNKDKRKNFDFLPNDGELFEGDMVMNQRLRSWVTGQFDKRDAINDESYMWPATTVEGKRVIRVPYTLSKEIREDQEKMENIKKAIGDFNRYTCIRYEPLEEDEGEYIDHARFIINKTMCYSTVGRQGGPQDISIGNGCERVGTIIHEMLHTLGLIHEQSRPDRDKYIKVFQDNIKSGLEHNFEKYSRREVKTLPTNKNFYDFDSCLHYNNYAFSKNGEDTIQSLDDPSRRFGQREGFSKHDIQQINELYDCEVEHLQQLMDDNISYD